MILLSSGIFISDGMAACELWREGNSYILSYLEFEFENPAIRYNSNSKKWSTADYVKAYIVDGRESYDILRKFCQRRQEWFPI